MKMVVALRLEPIKQSKEKIKNIKDYKQKKQR